MESDITFRPAPALSLGWTAYVIKVVTRDSNEMAPPIIESHSLTTVVVLRHTDSKSTTSMQATITSPVESTTTESPSTRRQLSFLKAFKVN